MARKNFACDFEATTDPDDCRVWAYGIMEIGKKEHYKIGNNLDDFMKWCKKLQGNFYFHNLKYDGSFIVNWLLKNGYKFSKKGEPNTFNVIISKMNQWYMVDICYGYRGKRKLHTKITDSLKKLPFSVEQIAKSFKLEMTKGELDYHKYRPPGHEITDEEHYYIYKDLAIIADALYEQFKQGLMKMTAGSDSLNGFKTDLGTDTFKKLFPTLSYEADIDIRKAYKGGFTWLKDDCKEKEIGKGMVFDVNSLYPSQMYYRALPYGMPEYFEGKYKEDRKYPLYIQHLQCKFSIKKDKIPTIQIKNDLRFKGNEYLKSSDDELVDLYVTNVDLELIYEHYELYDVEYIDGWKFKEKTGIFRDFITKWMHIKTTETGAKKQLAKLMLNSLYGKFASNPDVTGKVPYLDDDGKNAFMTGEEEITDPVYTPMGIFITSWARYTTISSAQMVYDRIIYCDTDSMHITGTDIPDSIKHIVDPDKLGQWDWESSFDRAKYLRQKTYIQEIDGELEVTCSGMTDEIKEKITWEEFEVGYSSYGRLMPRQVDGGVVLEDTKFTIKG